VLDVFLSTHKLLPDFIRKKESSALIIGFRSYFSCSAWRPTQDQDFLLAEIRTCSKVLSVESLQDEFWSKEDCLMREPGNSTIFVLAEGQPCFAWCPLLFSVPQSPRCGVTLRVEGWVER